MSIARECLDSCKFRVIRSRHCNRSKDMWYIRLIRGGWGSSSYVNASYEQPVMMSCEHYHPCILTELARSAYSTAAKFLAVWGKSNYSILKLPQNGVRITRLCIHSPGHSKSLNSTIWISKLSLSICMYSRHHRMHFPNTHSPQTTVRKLWHEHLYSTKLHRSQARGH